MKESYILKEDEILAIKGDRIFHDLWNDKEMDTIEWTVMQILGCSYEEIHGKVTVGNIRLINTSLDDKEKYVNLVVNYKNTITVIELNNNASDNYLRNVLYSLNCIINSYIVGDEYSDKKEIIYQYPMLNNKDNNDYLLRIINVNLEYLVNEHYCSIKK